MKYNFDEVLSRRGTNSVKWDSADTEEILPMWIADMDFQTFPPITEAVKRIAAQGHFGYNTVPDRFYDAIILWWMKRHHCDIQREWILPSTGVVSGISAIITTLAEQGDEVIIQTPAYNHFFKVIEGCRCKPVSNNLVYEEGIYRIDYEDLELKASSPKAKILLLCNPHNPVGRVWTEAELQNVASICAKHHVYVISDEIHSDLILTSRQHCTFISLEKDQNIPPIIVSSASKTFNLSGLHAAYIFVGDPDLRKRIQKQLWAQASGTPGLMACEALIVSYFQGDEWLAQLNDYLYENYKFLQAFVGSHLNKVTVLPLEATYLVWLDCKKNRLKSKEIAKLLFEKEKLWLNPGDMYGSSGEGFLRLNIACPRELLHEGLIRLKNYLENVF